jgi:hypothetical protein
LAALKISSDLWTVYAFSPTEMAARTTDRARGAREVLGADTVRIEIPEATAAAAAAAPAMMLPSPARSVGCVGRR